MFRRIEWVNEIPIAHWLAECQKDVLDPEVTRYYKGGIMTFMEDEVVKAWIRLNMPRRAIHRNCRFFFTEAGWREYGRPTIAACRKSKLTYRVIAIKERSRDVLYRDLYQVAVRPKRKRCASKVGGMDGYGSRKPRLRGRLKTRFEYG